MKYKMNGHMLPGINQKTGTNLEDGRAKSSAFQKKSPMKIYSKPKGKRTKY